MKYHITPRQPRTEQETEAERQVYDLLDSLNIDYEMMRHDAVFTMEDCAAMEATIGAPIGKNLFLSDRRQTQFYLLMLPASKAVNLRSLAAELGCGRLSFADESHMVELLGMHPGGVSPMGLIHDTQGKVQPLIDRELLAVKWVGCHPCVNTVTVKLSLADLLNKVLPATGHVCRAMDLKA